MIHGGGGGDTMSFFLKKSLVMQGKQVLRR